MLLWVGSCDVPQLDTGLAQSALSYAVPHLKLSATLRALPQSLGLGLAYFPFAILRVVRRDLGLSGLEPLALLGGLSLMSVTAFC